MARRRGSFVHGTAVGAWHHECPCKRCVAAWDELNIEDWLELVKSLV